MVVGEQRMLFSRRGNFTLPQAVRSFKVLFVLFSSLTTTCFNLFLPTTHVLKEFFKSVMSGMHLNVNFSSGGATDACVHDIHYFSILYMYTILMNTP